METHRKAYTAPVSEIVPAAQDVVTASQFLGEENTPLWVNRTSKNRQ